MRCGHAPIGSSAGRSGPNASAGGAIGRSTTSNADSTRKRVAVERGAREEAQAVIARRVVERDLHVDAVEPARRAGVRSETGSATVFGERARPIRREALGHAVARAEHASVAAAVPARSTRTRTRAGRSTGALAGHRIEVVLVAAVALRHDAQRVLDRGPRRRAARSSTRPSRRGLDAPVRVLDPAGVRSPRASARGSSARARAAKRAGRRAGRGPGSSSTKRSRTRGGRARLDRDRGRAPGPRAHAPAAASCLATSRSPRADAPSRARTTRAARRSRRAVTSFT